MIRASMILNVPVVCHDKQIGLLQGVGLDPAQKKVQVLIVTGGFKGKQAVFADRIISLTHDQISVEETVKYKRAYDVENARFAVNPFGVLAAKITDFMIDEQSYEIKAIQIMQGYSTREQRKRIWIFTWFTGSDPADALIIPNLISGEPFENMEEA